MRGEGKGDEVTMHADTHLLHLRHQSQLLLGESGWFPLLGQCLVRLALPQLLQENGVWEEAVGSHRVGGVKGCQRGEEFVVLAAMVRRICGGEGRGGEGRE